MNDYARIQKVIRYLDQHSVEQPSLATLARVVGLSESHFHKLFTSWAGVTPKDFLQVLTADHAKRALQESKSVLEASFAAGLSSPSRLHDLLIQVEAMSPGEWKNRGQGIEIEYSIEDSPLGRALIGVTARGVAHLAFVGPQTRDEKNAIQDLALKFPQATLIKNASKARKAITQLFARRRRASPGTSILMAGTPFQLKVWQALLQIPEGQVCSYGDLARLIGEPKSARAVGTAVGQNTIAVLIPCHRVIRETGALGGYRWGVERKKAILALESLKS